MAKDIKLYTVSACRHCQATKQYLRERGIPYREINVQQDKAGFKELRRLKGAGPPPVITVNGRVLF